MQAASKATSKKEAALQQLKNMESLMSYLISHGALLGAIRPALLLDAEDFRWANAWAAW